MEMNQIKNKWMINHFLHLQIQVVQYTIITKLTPLPDGRKQQATPSVAQKAG